MLKELVLSVSLFISSLFQVPLAQQLEQTPAACIQTPMYIAKWKPRLALKHWNIKWSCHPDDPRIPKNIPLRGFSITDAEKNSLFLWVNPDEQEPELIVVHELLHGIFYEVDYSGGDKDLHEKYTSVVAKLVYSNRK